MRLLTWRAQLTKIDTAYDACDASSERHEPEKPLCIAMSPAGHRTQCGTYNDKCSRQEKARLPAHPVAKQAYGDLTNDLP